MKKRYYELSCDQCSKEEKVEDFSEIKYDGWIFLGNITYHLVNENMEEVTVSYEKLDFCSKECFEKFANNNFHGLSINVRKNNETEDSKTDELKEKIINEERNKISKQQEEFIDKCAEVLDKHHSNVDIDFLNEQARNSGRRRR